MPKRGLDVNHCEIARYFIPSVLFYFLLVYTELLEAVVVTQMSGLALVLVWANRVFLCDGQGSVRRAVLYVPITSRSNT